MASEIRVDKITSLSGVGTISPSPTGVEIAGITTAATLKATTGIVTTLTATTGIVTTLTTNTLTANSTTKVGSGITLSPDGKKIATGITTVSGNIKVGSGITLSPDGHSFVAGLSTIGTLSVSGIVTGAGLDPSTGTITASGNLSALRVGIGTTNPQSRLPISHTNPSIRLVDTNQEADNKSWLFSGGSSKQFRIQALNDASGGGGEYFRFYRDDSDVEQFQGLKGGNPWFTVNNNTKRVGIGSTNPRTPIHILAGGGAGIIEIQRDSNNTTGNTGCINFTANDGHSIANIGAYGAGDNESAYINFKTTTAASANSPFTSTTERFRILASGGVTFNGDSATANALDDYEEGTFTPSYVNLDVPGHATTDYATYTKIGRLVLIRVGITISSSVNDGSGMGFTLPFAPTDNKRIVIPAISDRSGSNTDPFAFTNANQNAIIYAKSMDGYAWQTYNHFSGNYIVITGTYESA